MVERRKKYIPKKGDFISLTFDPQSGHEQKGRRPGLVVSEYEFNKATGFALVCPVTNTNKNYIFHQEIKEDLKVKSNGLTGFVMVDQVKSLDYRARRATFTQKADKRLIESVTHIIKMTIGE